MAPWPEGTDRTKASDTERNRTIDHLKSKSEPPEDKKGSAAAAGAASKDDTQEEAKGKDVHSLDDGQLKALLDEAIQYRNPKDRLGKSQIFCELLQKVEADESDCGYPVVELRSGFGRRALRKPVAVSERATRGGSLQNIFAAAGEFDTQHSGGARRKTKPRPGGSVSARQREGGSLPCWPVETWQTDQVRRKTASEQSGAWQTDQVRRKTGSEQSGVCAGATVTQTRRQTLMHSASNELPIGGKLCAGELYPLRRHHSSSDQTRSGLNESAAKHKSHSESSASRRMPQVAKSEYTSLDMGGLNLEMRPFCTPHSDRYRLNASDAEPESEHVGGGEVYTTRASLEVESVDSTFQLDLHHVDAPTKPLVNMKLSDVDCVELNENYTCVQSLVGDHCDTIAQVRNSDSLRHHTVYKTVNSVSTISLVNISAKPDGKSLSSLPQLQAQAVDENGNPSQQGGRGSAASATKKNHHKRKLLSEKNVVCSVSQNIAGYRGDKDLETVLSFIENDRSKVTRPPLKKAGVLVGSLSTNSKSKKHKRQEMTKSSSLEEISQRNLSDLTESAESERSVVVRKPRSSEDTSRERRSWGDQVYIRSESQNDITTVVDVVAEPAAPVAAETEQPTVEPAEAEVAENSDSEFQMVTKKQRKRKSGGDSGGKRGRQHRPNRRSPRRKSTSSVPPSERSGDSDVDSVHSLPVGGQPAVMSYAHIAAGAGAPFDKSNDIEEWCNSVTQHMNDNPAHEADTTDPTDNCDSNNSKKVTDSGNKVAEVNSVDRRPVAPAAAATPAVPAQASRKNWPAAQSERKREGLNREEFPSLPTKNGGWRKEEPVKGKVGKEARSQSAGRSAVQELGAAGVAAAAAASGHHAAQHRPAVILLQDEQLGDSSVCEITFGFEVNELLLTADRESQEADETQPLEPADEESCSSSSSDLSCSKSDKSKGEITNSTVQELFKRHETLSTMTRARCGGIDIADAYVPPKTPVHFNHDKIVNFVGLAWEDVLRQGKIQYYTADN